MLHHHHLTTNALKFDSIIKWIIVYMRKKDIRKTRVNMVKLGVMLYLLQLVWP